MTNEEKIALLERENTSLQETLLQFSENLSQLTQENSHLREQLNWLQKQLFGKKSEKLSSLTKDSSQLTLFDVEQPSAEQQITKPVAAHQRRVSVRDGLQSISFPETLPIKEVVLDIAEEKKFCQETKEKLVEIGREVTDKLAFVPGSYYIKRIIRPKYGKKGEEEKGVFCASLPSSILHRCFAEDSFLAQIAVEKFGDHLPFYRIEERLKREGIYIPRKLFSQWMMRTSVELECLFELMKQKILESKNLFCDESPVLLQQKGKCKKGYVWVLAGEKEAPYRVYQFFSSRSHEHVEELLKGYQGVLHSDKYEAYHKMAVRKQVTWCPCYVHIRRKFIEAESGDALFRDWVLRKMRYLFLLEKVAWGRSAEERVKIREEKELPIIEELILGVKKKLENGYILPKSKFKEALGYFYSLAPYLKNYLKEPYARLENNTAERAIRPLVIGRKNWLFFGSPKGAKAGCILLSLVQTCRNLKINPQKYLEDTFRKLPELPYNRLEELLPDNWLKTQEGLSANSVLENTV